ncbi:CRISPR-associated helicase/endonuclease Cas3 [Halalkalibacter hemicellulosilyticus]|uniref:CRISPR-associated helicase Cas3 n=1 Tax=Halalkalibacter hemicellulosilyticusJCM 9152 TaxID=1236971 RepID=W4Q9M6_9BACI|nr:CRISPR-associated helicase/endonuclease Cas3 [Halalkalibacter hemicellulosilyticus]GAE28761.1 CRISPR-associated helicase Cas3 [Halalkalibacter hemicellulosilyticusJCM 9152]
MYVAHIREKDRKIQELKDHLCEVQHLAEQYGEKIGLKHVAGLAGLLHDLGKYSDEFQDYIHKAVFHPDLENKKRGQVDHSSAGGRLLFQKLHQTMNTPYEKLLSEIVANAIISHHSNLQDYVSPDVESPFLKRVEEKELIEYEQAVERFFQDTINQSAFDKYITTAVMELEQKTDYSPTQSFFLTKFIFSCLIDADRTNTRQFEDGKAEGRSDHSILFDKYYDQLITKLDYFRTKPEANYPINQLRTEMSEQCELFANKPSGIYSLSIPTGGGKTLASLRYALKHAKQFNKQRIIYVVPFTTIIEQNAKEIRTILEEDEHILEHHSNVVEDDPTERDSGDEQEDGMITKKQKLKLARDNWDSPIIFTTMVQFLNVFYAKGNRNTRRFHNVSHSIVIFDEVQKVPTKCVSLFNEALNFLKADANCSILLCTATQPTLENVKHSLLKNRDGEIVENLPEVAKAFKRVEVIDRTEQPMTNDMLVEWMEENAGLWGSTLVILNTKRVVKELYEKLKGGSLPVFHLSTSMCAAHRKEKLEEIRKMLNDNTPFICVTTQLIEAGVDVSFKCVVRSLAGLDSIAQAAGRCNRHGENEVKNVYVIDHSEENLSELKEIEVGKGISSNILARFNKKPDKYEGNLLLPKAMHEYFSQFYRKMDTSLSYFVSEVEKDMTRLLMSLAQENSYVSYYQKKIGTRFPLLLNGSYLTAAKHFQVIDQNTTSVLVPYKEGSGIIANLNSAELIDDLSKELKKAQQYSVNLYPNELEQLKKENAIVMHLDGMMYELKEGWYSEEYGVDRNGEGEMSHLFY